MPARWVPLLYFGLAHLCLAAAFAALALEPTRLSGFFYHPRMLAVVHLVTLGWITASILGALYIVAPLAFRAPLPARTADYVAFGGFAVGVLGMASHFWMDLPSGMAWAAALVACAMSYVGIRALRRILEAPIPFESRLPLALALVNMIFAAGLGVLAAVNKVAPVLEIAQLDAVFAHAHLAALGWATMMVVGAGYRILPMILPAAMPRGPWVFASALFLECGVLGLVWTFLAGGRGLPLSAALTVAGIATFLSRVVWMLRNRRPAPRELRRPDWSVAHALLALACLVAACGLGLHLAVCERSEATLALAPAYGVLGLVGFLSQMVVGIFGRVLPLFAWLWGFSDRSYSERPPSLHRVTDRSLQGLGFVLWATGVPWLAVGLVSDRAALVSGAAWALLLAVVTGLANAVIVLLRLWRGAPERTTAQ
jgi:hypothetical protein